MQITVIERAQQIQIQEQEIIRRERELEATIRKPAEAEKYRLEKIADANRLVILHMCPVAVCFCSSVCSLPDSDSRYCLCCVSAQRRVVGSRDNVVVLFVCPTIHVSVLASRNIVNVNNVSGRKHRCM